MEIMSESERNDHGRLGRECEAALVVAAMQGLFLSQENEEDNEQSTQ
jgi:hypothetical protein